MSTRNVNWCRSERWSPHFYQNISLPFLLSIADNEESRRRCSRDPAASARNVRFSTQVSLAGRRARSPRKVAHPRIGPRRDGRRFTISVSTFPPAHSRCSDGRSLLTPKPSYKLPCRTSGSDGRAEIRSRYLSRRVSRISRCSGGAETPRTMKSQPNVSVSNASA